MRTVTFSEFRRNASGILDLVEKGEKVCILRHGKIIANIVPPWVAPSNARLEAPGPGVSGEGVSLSRAVIEERRSKP